MNFDFLGNPNWELLVDKMLSVNRDWKKLASKRNLKFSPDFKKDCGHEIFKKKCLVYMNLLGKSHHTVPRMKVITCGARLDNPAYCDLTQKNRSVCNKEKNPIKSFYSRNHPSHYRRLNIPHGR